MGFDGTGAGVFAMATACERCELAIVGSGRAVFERLVEAEQRSRRTSGGDRPVGGVVVLVREDATQAGGDALEIDDDASAV